MTEYQKIEKELLAAGWTVEPGTGDHMKFKKGSLFYTVPRGLSANGRTMKNIYSDLRKLEPEFTLGKAYTKKAKEKEEEEPRQYIPENTPEWMKPGSTVRWTKPENRDWRKITETNSVMSQKYTVLHFDRTETEDVVLIRDEKAEHMPFTVKPSELDQWETDKCTGCGAILPLNQLIHTDMGNMCETCHGELEQMKQEDKQANTPDTETKTQETPAKIKDIFNDMPENMQRLHELSEYFETEEFIRLGSDKKLEIYKEAATLATSLPSRFKKNIKRKCPQIWESVTRYNAKDSTTPYETWKRAIHNISQEIFLYKREENNPYNETEIKNDLHQNCNYTIKTIKDPTDKKKNAAIIIIITTKQWRTARIIYNNADIIIEEFYKLYHDDTIYAILLQCPKENIKQYVIYSACPKETYTEVYNILKQLLPEKESYTLKRIETNLKTTTKHEIQETIKETVDRVNDNSQDRYIGILSDVNVTEDEYGDLEKGQNFETADAIYKPYITFNKDEDYEKYIANLSEMLEKNELPILKNTSIKVINMEKDKVKTFIQVEPKADKTSAIPEQIEINNDYLRIFHDEEHPDIITLKADEEKIKGKESQIADILTTMAQNNEPLKETLLLAAQRLGGKPHTEKEQTKDNAKMEKDILERTNPASDDKQLGGHTTRELLRELKSRGVEFQNLTITVKASLNMQDI